MDCGAAGPSARPTGSLLTDAIGFAAGERNGCAGSRATVPAATGRRRMQFLDFPIFI